MKGKILVTPSISSTFDEQNSTFKTTLNEVSYPKGPEDVYCVICTMLKGRSFTVATRNLTLAALAINKF